MSAQKPGTVNIVNNVRSATGQRLAATFQDQPNAIVTPLTPSIAQRWTITHAPGAQPDIIVPVMDQSKAATKKGSNVVILPKDGEGFGWTINRNGDGTFSIGDQSNNVWDLIAVRDKEKIVLTSSSGGQSRETQKWFLESAD